MHSRQAALMAALLLTGTGVSSAQTPPAQATTPQGAFLDSVEVRVVNLEVVVTDRQGNRVTGLSPEDFVLEVEKKTTPIDYFTEIRDGFAVRRSADDGLRGAPSIEPGQEVPTMFLVFIDGIFGFAENHVRLAAALDDQLDLLGPDDKMAIVAYERTRVAELSGWTGSIRRLSEAVRGVKRLTFDGGKRLGELQEYRVAERDEAEYIAATAVRGDPATPLPELPELRFSKKKLERQLDRITSAAVASMHRYGNVPGRKVMLLWSGGWVWNSIELFEAPNFGDAPQHSKAEAYLRRISDTANRLGYTLYAVDAPINRYDDRIERVQHQTLDVLAEETGGRALKDAAALKALGRATEDTRSYYWLGFTAAGKGDGERYRIKVETRRRDLKVRSRESYVDISPQQEISQQVEAVALIGESGDGPSLDVELGELEAKGRRMHVPLTVAIPLKSITMLPGAEGFVADLEIRISAVDDGGYMNDVPVVPLTFSGPEPKEGDVFYYETSLKLRRTPHDVTVAVYDKASGSILTRQLELSP